MDTNGATLIDRGRIEADLEKPLCEGYKPTLPLWALGADNDPLPQWYLTRDIERMMIHDHVRNCLDLYKSGIAGAEFWGGPNTETPDDPNGLPICAENPEAGQFIHQQCNRFWDRGVPKLQGGYEYGWIGCESLFADRGGLEWDDLAQFSPWDTFILTMEDKPVGVRVKQVQSPGAADKGSVDLWMATKDVPAKALWYAHNPRYNQFYGQSQLLGGWRPWRRLATKGAAETVLDGGFFRLGYAAPLIRYPDEDLQVVNPVPGTQLDSQGRPRRPARDIARQISEQMQAGAGMGMSSKNYPTELGGGKMWDVEEWASPFDGSHLIAYIEHLLRRISAGIGVPHELLEAMEGGSGYSGRAIPVEAWFAVQQKIADAMLRLFVLQVLRPLVRWRFGEVKWEVAVKPLLATKRKQQAGGDLGQKPGVNPGMPPPAQPGTHQGGSHHPHVGANPPPGMNDQGSAPVAPFSIGTITKVQRMAQFIRSMGGKAA